ncbi:OsmC family protein [Muricauda sp. 2012CJ35-5]|uniref:OsmC family protein n=1 Tax=Flagellimonas spongiicola TaxID=2942208 RepID=A0ABT0PND2_9FLAO|nr:OsmC family protein [Allomuricauda spongiicola]MCL6272900.1 OsmC family protein [Allomuricauda spongiicola]
MKEHHYQTQLNWTGNTGEGTKNYRSYERDFELTGIGKNHVIKGSSDPSFRGDKSRYNPEDIFVSSISSCHMLWFLHLCSTHKIIVMEYQDIATGIMKEAKDGSGKFREVTLNPEVTVLGEVEPKLIDQLHHEANKMCFIANSCNFPIYHKPSVRKY